MPALNEPPQPRAELLATLARIDGWGPLAWREIHGAWRLGSGVLVVEDRKGGDGSDDDADAVDLILVLHHHRLPLATLPDATCDWVLRQAWQRLIPGTAVRLDTVRPGAAVVATNACYVESAATWERAAPRRMRSTTDACDRESPGSAGLGNLVLRFHAHLPYAGMCLDGKRFARLVRQLSVFARALADGPHPGLAQHRRTVARARALRAALPRHGLVAFLGDGSRLARDRDDRPARHGVPLHAPNGLAVTLDLGRFGKLRGLGIRTGVTAVIGAPYHGKSTLLHALAAGRDDHPPGDGRETVVSLADTLAVQAEDGRIIKAQDLSGFFPRLPGDDTRRFNTDRASGATSMAASVLQGVAAGCRLLLVDEDSAASNAVAIDPLMRRLIGPALTDVATLADLVPALAAAGTSTVIAAGASTAVLAQADRIVRMDAWQPHDRTRTARRLLRRAPRPPADSLVKTWTPPNRVLHDDPDALFGPRHLLTLDVRESERPGIDGRLLDLRRAGWPLDPELVRGAILAAAWCTRLAAGEALDLAALRLRYDHLIAERGVRALDPFATGFVRLPPWLLVTTVLERLPRPAMVSHRP